MARQLRFNKARKGADVASNFSEAGSIEADQFTGWEEQQTGKASELDRTATQASSTGQSFQKKIKKGARLNQSDKFVTPMDFMNSAKVNSRNQAMFFMLREARKSRRTIMIPRGFRRTGKSRKMTAGIYGWQGNKLMRLQNFNTRYKPKKTDWMGDAINKLIKKRGGFEREFQRQLFKKLTKRSGRG